MRSLLLLLLLQPLTAAAHPVTMWLVEGETNRVYILGSVHLLRREDHPLPQVIEAAYDDAEALIMELDMDDLDATLAQASATQLGVIRDERTLKSLMGDNLYAEASAAAGLLDIPFEMLEKTEPWFAAITVEQLVLMRIGFNPLYGVEMHMTMKATQDGKSIEGLETIEQQLGFLDGLSLPAQRALLMQTLEDGRDIASVMDSMIDAWRNGDVDYLEESMLDEMAEHEELYDAIVVERNRRWVDTIEALLDDRDDYLVIVGALHLIGEDGVPALLSGRGIKIEQMNEPL